MSHILRIANGNIFAMAVLAAAGTDNAAFAPPASATPAPTAAAPTAPAAAAPKFAIRADVPVPKTSVRTGPGERYPFDQLQVGQSFGVMKAAKRMQSTLYSAMQRYGTVEPVVDGDGKPVLNAKGKPKTKLLKDRIFVCRNVDPTTDPDKAVARVWRTA